MRPKPATRQDQLCRFLHFDQCRILTHCVGRFWEGRFKCQALLDETAVLACSVYVDLNPIRAGIAKTPEASRFTSVRERITARQARLSLEEERTRRSAGSGRKLGSGGGTQGGSRPRHTESARDFEDDWLCPIDTQQESGQEYEGRRASEGGFLSLTLEAYLKLVDWTGRQVRRDKRGAIPAELAPILERLQVAGETWVESVIHFGRWFHRAVGRAARMKAAAERAGKRWFAGVRTCQAAFT